MKYPVLDDRSARAYVEARRSRSITESVKPEISWRELGDDAPDVFDLVEGVMEELLEAWDQGSGVKKTGTSGKDASEGALAVILFEGLRYLPRAVLTDRGFWRFLAVYWLFDFVQWRDGENCAMPSFGAQAGSGALWDCVPLRMFDRALIAARGADAVGSTDAGWGARVAGTDLWRSHILRVLIGNAPTVVHRMLEDVDGKKLPTGRLRSFAKNLQRTRANVMFELLDADDARALVDEHRALTESQGKEDGVAG